MCITDAIMKIIGDRPIDEQHDDKNDDDRHGDGETTIHAHRLVSPSCGSFIPLNP